MFEIVKNTYPNLDKFPVGTLCNWRVTFGHIVLSKCNKDGSFEKGFGGQPVDIYSHGQIFGLDGSKLNGKKLPTRSGIIDSFKKNGWCLEIKKI